MLMTDNLRNQRGDSPETVRHPVRPSEPRVLIADDQQDVLEALRLLLKAEGFQLESASSPAGVLAAIEAREFDVALIDLNYTRDTTSGEEGLNLLSRIQGIDPTLPVVVMTAWGSVEVAVEAMRRGARDFVQKPWDNARLLAIIRTQMELSQALRKGQRLEAENSLLRGEGMPKLIAESSSMQGVLQVISRVGPSDANVLVLGENGTGKGVIARALHAVSSRASRPMVVVNSGGVSEGVFESELFGHVRGAFTDAKADRVGRFELADQGTLFLDEIANVPLSQQAKLLRVRPLPAGPALPAEHDRNPPPSAARPPRGPAPARATLPSSARAALPQAAHRLRERGDADPARAPLARQRPRAGSRDRTGGVDGAGAAGETRRSRPAPERRRGRAARRHEPRGSRVLPHQEGHDPLRRQRQPGGQGARAEPQRSVPALAALRPVGLRA
jgi:FixJ family two-component response regulator